MNCVEWQSQKQLFEEILNQVAEAGPSPENGFTQYARCDNANDFVRLLKGVIQEKGIEETVYIVSDTNVNVYIINFISVNQNISLNNMRKGKMKVGQTAQTNCNTVCTCKIE